MTGRAARVQAGLMREMGTVIVGGATPGRGGRVVDHVPIFDTVLEAREQTGANASILFLPPLAVKDGILEAIDAEVPLIVCISEGAPVHDMLAILERLRESTCRSMLVGEIGGSDEERAAELIAAGYPKPVIGLIAGRTAPAGRPMGHAGAIIVGDRGTYGGKVAALSSAGVPVAESPAEAAELASSALR